MMTIISMWGEKMKAKVNTETSLPTMLERCLREVYYNNNVAELEMAYDIVKSLDFLLEYKLKSKKKQKTETQLFFFKNYL